MPVPTSSKKSETDTTKRVPCEKPPFSVGDLKKAIPPHCFKRSIPRSFSYLISDIIIASCFYYVATNYFSLLPQPLSYLAWPLYWACQGCVLTGIWVIAHECGHHAFSDYQWLDDTVGLIFHSFLLVPYFSWKYSHRRHHSNTGSLERDEVFVPKQKSAIKWYGKYLNNPLGRIMMLTVQFVLGWPLYLAFNVSGRPYDGFACHFFPNALQTLRQCNQRQTKCSKHHGQFCKEERRQKKFTMGGRLQYIWHDIFTWPVSCSCVHTWSFG